MSTTLSLFKHGWEKAPFDGSIFVNVTGIKDITFPDTTADGASQLYLAKNGVYVLFLINSSADVSQYRFLEPIEGQITDPDDAWTFNLGTVDETTQLYPLIFGTNNDEQVVCCPFVITGSNVSGTATITRLFVTNDSSSPPTTLFNATSMQNLLPGDSTLFPYVLRNKTTIADGDFGAYGRIPEGSNALRITLNKSVSIASVANNTIDVCFVMSTSDPQPVIVTDLGFNPSSITIASDGSAEYTINTAVTLAEKGTMSVSNTGANTLTINDYATQPSGFQPPSGSGVTYNSVPSAELPRVTADPLPRIANLQTVQRNLQTLYNQISSTLITVRNYDMNTGQYFATGELADHVWTQMRDELVMIVNEMNIPQPVLGDTEIIDYSLSLASDSTTTPLQVTIDEI